MPNVNDGHIIIKERQTVERGIRDATVAVLEHDRKAMAPRAMPKMNEDGLYEVEKPIEQRAKKLAPREIRALAEAFAARNGFEYRIDIDDTQARVELRRAYDRTKKNACGFSSQFPPTEYQMNATLDSCARGVAY